MQRYSKYKDSGVKWLGEIPSHWEVKHLRNFLTLFSEKGFGDSQLLSVTREKGVILRDRDNKEENHNFVPDDLSGYKHLNAGDFVINKMKSWQGSYGVSDYEGIVSPAYFTCKLHGINSKFFSRAIRSRAYIGFFMQFSKGIRVDQWDLDPNSMKEIPFVVPSNEEQIAIVNYLDSVTSKIDEAIAQQQKMIDLLNERKQIIINDAVTKGLDPKAKMKDSGIDWVGQIPEHWNVRKTLFCLSMSITDGPHETPQLYDEGIPFVSAEAVSCGNGRIDFDHVRGYISREFYEECCKKYIPKKNDIYMIKSGATTGKVALVDTDKEFTIWSPLAVFRCDQKVMHHEYMFFMLQSNLYQLQVQLGWTYGTQQNIGMRTLEKLKVPVPPINEQKQIANFITEKSKPIDEAIEGANQKIALLQERKQIIINDIVTGKVKV